MGKALSMYSWIEEKHLLKRNKFSWLIDYFQKETSGFNYLLISNFSFFFVHIISHVWNDKMWSSGD